MAEQTNETRDSVHAEAVDYLAFEMHAPDRDTEPGIDRTRFNRKPSEKCPALELVVVRSEAGYHVIANSAPFDPRCHIHTDAPVKDEEAIDILHRYVNNIYGLFSQE